MCNIYSIINDMRSMEEMRDELNKLSPSLRKAVILLALSDSRHQYTWSAFAEEFGVHVDEWPPKPRDRECARCIKSGL